MAVGLVQYLAQIGVYVPACEAYISICDNIYTHYPNLESAEKGSGRRGEEAGRLKAMIQKATHHRLVLLNETGNTSLIESILAQMQNDAGRDHIPGFKVIPGPPEGRSCALEIARRYGISTEQLMEHISP